LCTTPGSIEIVTSVFEVWVSFNDGMESISTDIAGCAGPEPLCQLFLVQVEESSKWYVNIFVILAKDIECSEEEVKQANV
jgi:hypothetical protein